MHKAIDSCDRNQLISDDLGKGNLMNQRVRLFPEEKKNALMSITTKGKTVYLLYRRLSQYDRDLTPYTTERVTATIRNGIVVGTVTAYKEQTGLIFAWDPVKNRILHVSDGEFAIQAILVSGNVYSLHCISYYGKYPELRLCRMKLGNKNMCKGYEILSLPDEVTNHSWPEGADVTIEYHEDRIMIIMGKERFSIDVLDL